MKTKLKRKKPRPESVTLTIKAGCGGPESYDCANLIWSMYMKWARLRKLVVEFGEPWIIKVVGPGASRLKNESGVHRVVRIAPSDPKKRRHTSFVLVSVNGENAQGDAPRRSYIFNPYTRVHDHKTDAASTSIQSVMDGFGLDAFLPDTAPPSEKQQSGK